MKYMVTLNGKQYEVEVEKGTASAVLVGNAPAASPAPAPAAAPSPAPAPAAAPAPSPRGSRRGKRFLPLCRARSWMSAVRQGQAVKAGDVLFILEAMKMENEICAPHDGTVTSVNVQKGEAVETAARSAPCNWGRF